MLLIFLFACGAAVMAIPHDDQLVTKQRRSIYNTQVGVDKISQQNGDLISVVRQVQKRVSFVESVVINDGKAINNVQDGVNKLDTRMDKVQMLFKDETKKLSTKFNDLEKKYEADHINTGSYKRAICVLVLKMTPTDHFN